MATWSVAGGKVTLTLEAGDTGVIQREHTFTAADGIVATELHTFYLEVNPDSAAVEAFLQVVGGDLTLATVSGTAQVLTARGDANGSAEITVRFGVREAGLGGGGESHFWPLDYPNGGAASADGWTVGSGLVFNNSQPVGPYSTGLSVIDPSGTKLSRTISGLTAGSTWRASIWGRPLFAQPSWRYTGIRITSGSSQFNAVIHGNDSERQVITGIATVTASNSLGLQILTSNDGDFALAGLLLELIGGGGSEVTFDTLSFCVGSGVGDGGTGTGGDPDTPGNEPIPEEPPGGWPEPPVILTAPFGISDISAMGYAFWKATIKRMTARATYNLLMQAEENDTFLILTPGPEEEQLTNGQFDANKWISQLAEVYNDVRTRDLLIAAGKGDPPFTKVRAILMLLDEPYHPFRRGAPVPHQTVVRIANQAKTWFPDLGVLLRVDPTDPRYSRIPAVDYLWMEYSLARGPIDSYLNVRIAAAQTLGHGIFGGIHYKEFQGPSGPTPRYVTPVEFTLYGGKMADRSEIAGMLGWKWEPGLVAQSGMIDSTRGVRDRLALSHAP